MRPRTLLLTALAATLLAIPTSAAQQQASIVVRLSPYGHTYHPGDSNGTTGTITFTFDVTAKALQPQGIPVSYAITRAPEWMVATISPSNDIIPTGYPSVGLSETFVKMFSIQLDALPNATGDRIDQLEVTAVSHPSLGGVPVVGRATLALRLVSGNDPCPAAAHETSAAGSTSASPGASNDAPVHVQSSAVSIPTISYVALGGFGLVGAGVGLFLRRRL